MSGRLRAAGIWVSGVVLVAAALLVSSTLVRAQPSAMVDGKAVMVSAEHLSIDLHEGRAVLEGKVQLRRGALTVSCDRVEARYDQAPNVTWAKATGNVVATQGDLRATAPEAELWMGPRNLQLRGGVRVTRGAGAWMEAREVQIELDSGRLTLEQVRGAIPVGSSAAKGADAGP